MRLLPTLVVFIVMMGLSGNPAAGSEDDSPSSGWSFKNNFSIPDAPAYLLLGVEPTSVLRPETPRELGLGLSKFTDSGGQFSLPKALALEFSPYLLTARDSLTLTDYKKKKYWYATRVSVATQRDSLTNSMTRVGGGIRITLVDDRTIGTDLDYEAALGVTDLTRQIKEIRVRAVDRAREAAFNEIDEEVDRRVSAGELAESLADSEKRDARLAWIQEHQNDSPVQTAEEDTQIGLLAREIRRRFTERYWNATVLDMAAGVRASSPDSTGRDMKLDTVALWASYALRTGAISQLVMGIKAGSERDSISADFRMRLTIGFRYYLGSAFKKAFVESQLDMVEDTKSSTILIGGLEASVTDWVWINFTIGRARTNGGSPEVVSSFKLKTSVPEL